MKALTMPVLRTAALSKDPDSGLRLRRRKWAKGLIASVSAACVTGLFGLLFAAASLLHFVAWSGRVSATSTILLAVSFPLLIVAAHCLDKMDEINHAIRSAQYRRTRSGALETK